MDERGFGVADSTGRPVGPTTPFVPDAIGLGVASLLMGYSPGGTLALFYPVFDVAALAFLLVLLRGLYWAVGGAVRAARPPQPVD